MLSIPASAFSGFFGPTCTCTAVYADGSTIEASIPCIYFGTDAPGTVGAAADANSVRLAFRLSDWPKGAAIPPPRSILHGDTATPPRFDRLVVQKSEQLPGGMVFLECSTREVALP